MAHPKASENLHGYKRWRSSLIPRPLGTVVKWLQPYKGVNAWNNIKAGQRFKIKSIREPIARNSPFIDADMVYCMIQCSASGKEFKREQFFSVEGIENWIEDGKVEVLTPQNGT